MQCFDFILQIMGDPMRVLKQKDMRKKTVFGKDLTEGNVHSIVVSKD